MIAVLIAVTVVVAGRLNPSRGKVKWPGIRLGEAILTSEMTELTPVDDMLEENLLRALVIPTDGSGGAPIEDFERFDEKASARNASYHFRSDVRDGIKGGQLHREETRRGAQVLWEFLILFPQHLNGGLLWCFKVNGSYSYSDGFVLRTVEYQADENGYRVIKWVDLFLVSS